MAEPERANGRVVVVDAVLGALEEANARLADLEQNADAHAVADVRARLLASVSALRELQGGDGDSPDGMGPSVERERRRYRELFELAPSAYLITNAASAIEEANAAAGRLLGVEPRQLVHTLLAAFVARGERRRFRAFLSAFGRGEGAAEHEFRFRARGGEFVAGVTVGQVQRSDTEPSLRLLIRDVTTRRRDEDEIRALETRVEERTAELDRQRALLDTVVEQMPAGIVIVDALTGRLLLANGRAWEIARERFDEPEGLEPLVAELRDGAEGRELVEVLRRDGSRGTIEIDAAAIRDPEEGVIARVAVFQDVTARDRVERAEREFITNAAHELQTPLTAITSAAEVLQAGAKLVPADRDRFLTHIQRECDRLTRLVRALLTLSRAQAAGSGPAAPERLTLRGVLEDVAARMRPAEGVLIEVDCAPRLVATANRELVEQALTSVVGNAIKYTGAGTIRLAGRRLDAARVAVEVIDTGPGIPEVERELVRKRFYRGFDRERPGFGLGLAIADQAASALGGALEIESGPEGGGTTVRLVLPSRRAA